MTTATQEAISALRTIAASDWLGQITPTLAGVVVDHITSLEARNEAMATVVAAARTVSTDLLTYDAYQKRIMAPLEGALAALDAQAGEVTG